MHNQGNIFLYMTYNMYNKYFLQLGARNSLIYKYRATKNTHLTEANSVLKIGQFCDFPRL